MKKRLNLLNRKKRFNAFSQYANKIKRIGTVLGILLFILFIFIIYQTFMIRSELADLDTKKRQYLSLLLEDKDTEASMRYFKGKQTQLLNFEKDDVRFVPYYSVLLETVHNFSESATLDNIEIDKERKTKFTIRFTDYDGMISFLKYVESESFLKNFDDLSVTSLSLSREDKQSDTSLVSQKKQYQLQFKGRFIQLND